MTHMPLFDCRMSHSALTALEQPLNSGQLAAGPAVGNLEQWFDARFPGRHAVAVSDMTNALALALKLTDLRPGDEVLTLSFNCMSSNAAITMSGLQPVWVDVDPETASFDIEQARSCLTARTKVVVVYHVSGYPADLLKVRKFCDDHGLVLIEDANNAFGASVGNHDVGMVGDFAVFSLYANRQINGIDGGVLLCREPEVADRARRLRRFGIDLTRFRDRDGEISPQSDIPEIGTSAALNNIQATLALVSVADLDERIAQSRRNARLLAASTSHLAINPVKSVAGGNPVYWTWLILLTNRDPVMRALKAVGVMCSKLHFPNHHYTGFPAGSDPLFGTTILERELLAIPCGWWVDEQAIQDIAVAIEDALKTRC